jgi:hypothetical protein
MTKDLIINPYAQITTFKNEEKIALDITVPVPGKAKSYFRLESSLQPDLVEFIADLTNCGFDQFRAEDLTREELDLLIENGFLVDKTCAPEKPFFHYFLDEIKPKNNADVFDDLVVNASFRLESFDLAQASELIRTNNFSPDYPIAWVKLPLTEIEIGYWLRGELAEIAQKFIAGEKLAFEIDEAVLSKFVAANILINPDFRKNQELETERQLRRAHLMFQSEKYTVVENILPAHYMRAMKAFFRQYIANGFMPFSDAQVKRRFYEHNLPLARFFHRNFTNLMSFIVGKEVKPSYVYAASYVDEAALDPHIDRAQCEYSISFQVDYQPEMENDLSPWGLYVSPLEMSDRQSLNSFSWDDYPEDDPDGKKSQKIQLKSGDGLIYKGCELVHYRYPLAKGHTSTSLFFHYVSNDFAGELN